MVFYPNLNHEGLDRFREKFDPSYPVYKEHMPFLHPIPDSVTLGSVQRHLARVLDHWEPFSVHFNGLIKSWDHWLLLGVREGADKVRELRYEIYSGILKPFLREDLPFEPHLGLGLFAGDGFDPFSPVDSDLREAEYNAAYAGAKKLNFDFWCKVNVLDLIKGENDLRIRPVTIREYNIKKRMNNLNL